MRVTGDVRNVMIDEIDPQCILVTLGHGSESRESVKEHIDSLYAKIGAANRTEAVAIAFRKHLLKF